MKRRLILTFLIICLVFTVFSCSKAPKKTTEQDNNDVIVQKEDALRVTLPASLGNSVYNCTDLFAATVLDSEALPKKTPILHENIFTSDAVLYTVEIKSTVRDFSIAENTKVHVVRFVREADKRSEDYFLPFEIGKTYLICGKVQILDGKPFILDDCDFSVEMKDDGTLVPLSLKSSELFKDIKTYDELMQNDDVKNTLENYDICLPKQFEALLKTKPSWLNRDESDTRPRDRFATVISEKEEVQKLIREALPIDSKKTIDIKTVTYEELLNSYTNSPK